MGFTKYTKILLMVMLGLSALLTILFYFGPADPVSAEPKVMELFIQLSYVLGAISVISVFGFLVFSAIVNPKSLKGFSILAGVSVVIIGVARLMSSDQLIKFVSYTGPDNVPSVLKNVDTGLYSTYILFGLAISLMVYSEIVKIFK